ncbi:hypothetical protein AMTRI_Chr05g59930 [Amborella trichopoda]|uniref:Uncharacterized protein n=1 Tax=Amborella trichopoda TaxID=13333 RepID=U5CZC1_AMBTC|nr:uncharacterized protein LOC18443621 [Amborella trichopoda]ERN15335.1 hypothetical protein AMTR_s00036p00121900 [Amborella trichopoda]|eukprot:XP_006853868.1 uncharacterized protein LOC18443621 [Amborella trichopoda]
MEESKPEENVRSTDVKAPNLLERAKEEIEAIMHSEKSHERETHGTRDDIDENTPLDEVKAPTVFERAKEEIEALVQTVHPKKEPINNPGGPPEKNRGGFWAFLGSRFEKFCSPNR